MNIFKRNSYSTIMLSLFLAMGISSNVSAAPGGKKGQHASIKVFKLCSLEVTDTGAKLIVNTTITDTSSNLDIDPIFTGMTVQPLQRSGSGRWKAFGSTETTAGGLGHSVTEIDLCQKGGTYGDLDPEAKAVNILMSIQLMNGKKDSYNSRCDDNPDTEVVEAGPSIAGLSLCQ